MTPIRGQIEDTIAGIAVPGLFVGVVMWPASRRAIDRGLADGSPERAEEVLEHAEAR